jgi:glyoxylase-like metal-dependent hydrolase (beta-lactamase superfamily II)
VRAARAASLMVALAAAAATTLPGCAATRELGAVAFHGVTQLMPADAGRRDVGHGVEVVCARGTLVWIVPVADGVVLVDAGFDDEARAVKHALAGRPVRAILLTHGHVDHTAGALAFPDAPVFIGAADAPALDGRPMFRAAAPIVGEALAGVPARAGVVTVDDRFVLELGGARFTVLAVPGHTPGSVAWRFADVVFTGDAALSPLDDGAIYPAAGIFTEDMDRAYDSLRRLLHTPGIAVLADGHYGALPAPQPQLRAALERQHEPLRLHEHPLVKPAACADDPVLR